MSASSNLDLVRSIVAAWEHGDFTSAEWAHPEIEFVRVEGPSPGSYSGRAGMAEGFRDFLSVWEDLRATVDEYRELDGELILVLLRATGRGKTSGLELGQMEARAAMLFHIADGNVTRLLAYYDRDRAFADLGLARD